MTTVKLCGTEYPLRFSLRVLKACQEKYGSVEKMFDTMQTKTNEEGNSLIAVDDCLWLFSVMLDAGARYAEHNGIPHPDATPDEDVLLDVLDIQEMQKAVFTAISGDNARTVEAVPGKNGESAAAES